MSINMDNASAGEAAALSSVVTPVVTPDDP